MKKTKSYSNILKKGTYFSFIVPSVNNIVASDNKYDEKLGETIKQFIDYYKDGRNTFTYYDSYLDSFKGAHTKDYEDSVFYHRYNLEYLFYIPTTKQIYPYFYLYDFGITAKDFTKGLEKYVYDSSTYYFIKNEDDFKKIESYISKYINIDNIESPRYFALYHYSIFSKENSKIIDGIFELKDFLSDNIKKAKTEGRKIEDFLKNINEYSITNSFNFNNFKNLEEEFNDKRNFFENNYKNIDLTKDYIKNNESLIEDKKNVTKEAIKGKLTEILKEFKRNFDGDIKSIDTSFRWNNGDYKDINKNIDKINNSLNDFKNRIDILKNKIESLKKVNDILDETLKKADVNNYNEEYFNKLSFKDLKDCENSINLLENSINDIFNNQKTLLKTKYDEIIKLNENKMELDGKNYNITIDAKYNNENFFNDLTVDNFNDIKKEISDLENELNKNVKDFKEASTKKLEEEKAKADAAEKAKIKAAEEKEKEIESEIKKVCNDYLTLIKNLTITENFDKNTISTSLDQKITELYSTKKYNGSDLTGWKSVNDKLLITIQQSKSECIKNCNEEIDKKLKAISDKKAKELEEKQKKAKEEEDQKKKEKEKQQNENLEEQTTITPTTTKKKYCDYKK